MRTAGIIAEYDPFHRGHAWQLAEARRRGAQHIIVALSCGVVQRGGLPLLPEPVRVAAALAAGADLVLALPAPCACRGAEGFAAAGVALLAAAGCDTLVFGAETADAAGCLAAAQTLLSPAYRTALHAALAGGAPHFAAARQAALAAVCPAAARLVQHPNDNLGVEYAKAVLAQGAPLALCPLPRQGAAHGQAAPAGGYASGTALRQLWAQGGAQALAGYLPAGALALYAQAAADGQDTDPAAFSTALLALLRSKADAGFAGVRGVSEGLDNALARAVRTAPTAQALYDRLTTVRYPRARIRRLALDAALGWGEALNALPPYLHILGARRAALPLLAGAALPASPSLARLSCTGAQAAAFAAAQAQAADLAALCRRTPAPMGLAYTQPCAFCTTPPPKN